MRNNIIFISLLIILLNSASTITLGALLCDDFEDGNFTDKWGIAWKNAGGFEEKDGVLQFVPGGAEIATKEKFDFSSGVTFEAVFTRTGDGDFALFVNEEQTAPGGQNIWNSPSWIGIFVAGGQVNVRITQSAQPQAVPEATQGTPMKLSLFLDSTQYKGYMDGKLFDEGEHGLKFSKGHMIFSSAAVPGQMDNAVVYKGDYQSDAFEKGQFISPCGRLSATWSYLKWVCPGGAR